MKRNTAVAAGIEMCFHGQRRTLRKAIFRLEMLLSPGEAVRRYTTSFLFIAKTPRQRLRRNLRPRIVTRLSNLFSPIVLQPKPKSRSKLLTNK